MAQHLKYLKSYLCPRCIPSIWRCGLREHGIEDCHYSDGDTEEQKQRYDLGSQRVGITGLHLVYIHCLFLSCNFSKEACLQGSERFLIRDHTYMSRQHGGGVRTGPSRGLQNWGPLILTRVRRTGRGEHWEKKTYRWERRGEKRGVSFGEHLSSSVVSDADVEAGREAGPERLLNVNPCCTICRLCVLSKGHYLPEPLLSAWHCGMRIPDIVELTWG